MNDRPANTTPVPAGFRIALDAGTIRLDTDIWFGGSPARVVRLTAPGRTAWTELCDGAIISRRAGMLARRLTDAGLAHPLPPTPDAADVTVIIPVYNRTEALERCLAALGSAYPIVVVDDASCDARAVADVAHRRGATLVRRAVNGGAGAARNTGLAHVNSEFVAFLDSDCMSSAGWITRLVGHLADPLVAAAAPRITAIASDTWAGRYTTIQGSLDLGAQPARVTPGARVSYVPTAALVVRRAALRTVARDGAVFDPTLRVGEDVDLIWRLHGSGWRIRYDPSVAVPHEEPATWHGLLARRFRYGTSAASLAERHGAAMAPIVLHPWPALTVAALLSGHRFVAGAAFGTAVLTMHRTLRRARIPTRGVVRAMASAAVQTWLGVGRYCTQFGTPVLVAGMAWGGRTRRAGAASLLLAPPIAAWWPQRQVLDPARFTLGWLADQMCYGAGVWAGCADRHTSVPVRPIVTWKSVRIESRPRHQLVRGRLATGA